MLILPLFILGLLATAAQAQQGVAQQPTSSTVDSNPSVIAESPYAVTDRDANQSVWSSITLETNAITQQITAKTNSYTELATGLNFWNQATAKWELSQEEFQLTKDGYAIATNGQHCLILAPDIASSGSVDLLNPDGIRLISNPMALSFADASSGKNVMLAQVTNSVGQLDSKNSVLYPNAFDSIRAAIRLTYTRSGIEQDVILYQKLPAPEDFGLDPASTKLQMWTEVITEASPQISPTDANDDRTLDFGQTRIGHGVAYMLNSDSMDKVGLEKDWVEADGRRFIVESVPYVPIKPLLEKLQASASNSKAVETAGRKAQVSRKQLAQAFPRRSQLKEMAAIQHGNMSKETGLLLDYSTINTSQTNYVFRGDLTYWLSGNVGLFGTNTTFESGSILKSTNGVTLTVNTPITWGGSFYRPVIFTSKDDKSCGDSIAGATGNPGTNLYAATALAIAVTNNVSISHLRVANAQTAISFIGGSGHVIRHAQFITCQNGIAATNTGFSLGNALFWNVLTNFTGSSSTGRVEHLTTDTAAYLNQNIGANLFLTNCLLVNVTNTGSYSGLSNALSTSATVFQTVGEGFHYLLDSTYRNSGTTNITASLAADLRKMTTYPPLVLTNAVSTATTWSPIAQRDTDVPDLGWHYYPLDLLINNVSNSSTLTLTNGVAVGVYGNYGVNMRGGSLYSQGTPLNLNVVTYYHTVQEQPATLGASPSALLHVSTSVGTIQLRFTDFPALGNASATGSARVALDPSSPSAIILSDCQLRGSAINIYQGNSTGAMTLSLTNNLLERGALAPNRAGTASLTVNLRNNLFWRSTLDFQYNFISGAQNPVWSIQDNVLDNCSVSEGGTSYQYYIGNSYNGYINTGVLAFSGGGDKSVSTFNYATGPLGPWYQSSTNMINFGSRTADLAGLYQYTTQASQVKETNSVVDIGWHLVAINPGTGLPYDSDGDGIPDYLEDANGNGVFDTGETDWLNYNSPNGLAAGSGLQVFTHLKP